MKNLIVTLVPKTGGTTLNEFFKECFSDKYYELCRRNYGDPYTIVNAHNQVVDTLQEPFVLMAKHHGIVPLAQLVPAEMVSRAVRVVTWRDPFERIKSVYNGNKYYQRHTFSEFTRLYLNNWPRVTIQTYHSEPDDDKQIHLLPQHCWLKEPHDMEIRLENMVDDLRTVLQRAEWPHDNAQWVDSHRFNERWTFHNARPTPIGRMEHERIVKFYRDDFLWGK